MEPAADAEPVLRLDAVAPVSDLATYTGPAGTTVIAAACGNGRVELRDAETGAELGSLSGHAAPVTRVAANGRYLMSAGDHQPLRTWNSATSEEHSRIDVHDVVLDVVLFGSPTTSRFAVVTGAGELRLGSVGAPGLVLAPESGVTAVAATDTGLVAAHAAGLTVRSGDTARHLDGSAGIRLLAAAGDRLVTCGADDALVVRDLGSGRKLRRLDGHTTAVTALEWVPLVDGGLVASASRGGTIRLWDPDTGEQVEVLVPVGHARALAHFTGSDGGTRLVSAGDEGTIEVWDLGHLRSTRLGPVLTRGFGDRTATVDLLDRDAFVSTAAELLRPASTTDSDVGPNVLTVEGPWGSGKSTLLELVKARLTTTVRAGPGRRLRVWQADSLLRRPPTRAPSDDVPLTASVVATFNPWRHQSSEQVWAGLAKCVTDAVEDALLPDVDGRERHWFTRNTTRIDRRHTQRELWKRIRSPFLAVGVLGLGLAVVAQLAKLPIPLPWLIAVPAAPLVVGLLHTAKRYCWDRASAFLPGELFAGPVSAAAASAQPVADPYYNARSGYLYLAQHDVTELLHDLEQHGLQLVVFVDDLDRCTPKTTAEVFEAINVFLSESLPRTRFVLGLDPVVVASHVDRAYRELADAEVVAHPDDPSPGWTFLRKLVQLPIRLPRTTADDVTRVLDSHLGPVHHPGPTTPTANARPATATAAVPATISAEPGPARPLPRPAVEAAVVAIERHADVRAYLHRRLTAQPEQSIREEKRLVNVWQFYLRVLVGTTDVRQACHLVTIAELVTRWPAHQHVLRKHLTAFAEAQDDDLAWGTAVARAGLKHAGAAADLRELLRDCDARAVAALAKRLL
ncbi:P-loop NTPase fold protein [Umezawaea tangerina]|uniref:WD40 repeat protein n=1 Tax=Umezawaea tangerina TaxID=84725 RepID=A0A2T0SRZ6_9PSEU|nr:P-loop NTPase fold protein [Umezawaea tangerina]PRY36180.1 WD40 repeat protein [Umezawaea tangerina]